MRVGVVVVAGGRGSRVGADQPKQLLAIAGRSILQRSVDAFDDDRFCERVVVLPADYVNDASTLLPALATAWRFVAGGARRQDSVEAGVAALSADVDVVLVHDAARPFVSRALITRVIDRAAATGAAVPALAAVETVKHIDLATMTVRATVPRQEVWLAQTPQGFRRTVLSAAFAHNKSHDAGGDVTDEGMLAERAGFPVTIVPGDAANMKMTTAEDIARAQGPRAPRVGTGYDLHRMVEGRPLVLAGVSIPFERGPLGHSDGDVLCHSLTDALLGAAGAGDIGKHFPNTDPAWKGAPGLDLLERAVAIVHAAGFQPASADITIILERPKLLPHIDAMRADVARVLGVDLSAVSIKGKTNEGVDAVGRGEAIAAHAVAVLTARGDA